MPTSSERIRLVLEVANPSIRDNLKKDINVKMKLTLDKSSGGGFSLLQKWQESGLNIKVNLQLGGSGFNQIQRWITNGITIKTRFETSGGSYSASGGGGRAGINPKPKTGPSVSDLHPEQARRQDLIQRATASGINYRGRSTDQLEAEISAKEQQNAQKSLDRAVKTFEIYRQIAKKQQEIFEQQQKAEAIRKRSASNSKAFSDSFFSELNTSDISNTRPVRTIPSFTNRGAGPSIDANASRQFDQAFGNEFKNFVGNTLKTVAESARGTIKEFTFSKGKPGDKTAGDQFINEFMSTLRKELQPRPSGVKTVNSLTTPRPDYEKGSEDFNRSFVDEFRRTGKTSKGPKTVSEAYGQGISPEDLEERQRQDTQFERNAQIRKRPPTLNANQAFRNKERLKRATERALLSPVFSDLNEEIERSAFDFGVDPGDVRKSIGNQRRRLIDPRRLGAKGVAREATFAFLFGGLPGLGGALAGATVSPEGGSFVGATLAQKAADTIGDVFHKVAEALGEAAQAGLEFERSILTISSVLQKNVNVVTPTGAPADIKDVVQFQDQRARAIQRKARPALAKIGIAGSAEATLLRGLLTGAASRGFNFDPDQIAELAGLLGGATSLFAPELKENPSLFAKNIEEFVQGKGNASRTVLGSAIPSVLQESKRASNPEEFIKAARALQPLLDVLKNSDNVAASLTKLNASFDILKTTVGDEFLKSLAPGIKQLADTLGKSKVGDSLVSLAKIIGAFASELVKIAAMLLEKFGAKAVTVPGGALAGAGAGAALGFGVGSFFGGPLVGGLLGAAGGAALGGIAGGFAGGALGDLANKQSAAVRAQLDAENSVKNPKGLLPVQTPESVIQGILAPIGLGEGSFDQAADTKLQSNPFYQIKILDKALDSLKLNATPDLKDKFLPGLLTERLEQLKKLQDVLENNFDDFTFAGQKEKLSFRKEALGTQESESHALISSLQKKLTNVGPETDEGVKVSAQLEEAQQNLSDILKKEAQVGHDLVEVDQARIHTERSLRDATEDVRHAKVEEALETRKLTRDLSEANTAVKEFASYQEEQVRSKEQDLLGAAKEVTDLGGVAPNILDFINKDPELTRQFKLASAEAKLNHLLETVGLPGVENQSGAFKIFGSTGGSFQEKLQHEKESLEDNVKGINEQLRKLIEVLRSAVEKLEDLFKTEEPKLREPDRFGEKPKYPKGKGKGVDNAGGKPQQTGKKTFKIGATSDGTPPEGPPDDSTGNPNNGAPGGDGSGSGDSGGGVSPPQPEQPKFGPPEEVKFGAGVPSPDNRSKPNNPFNLTASENYYPEGNTTLPAGLTYGASYRNLFGTTDDELFKSPLDKDSNSMLWFSPLMSAEQASRYGKESVDSGYYNGFNHDPLSQPRVSKDPKFKALEEFLNESEAMFPFGAKPGTFNSSEGMPFQDPATTPLPLPKGFTTGTSWKFMPQSGGITFDPRDFKGQPSEGSIPNTLEAPLDANVINPRMTGGIFDHKSFAGYTGPKFEINQEGNLRNPEDFSTLSQAEKESYLSSGEVPRVMPPDPGSAFSWDGVPVAPSSLKSGEYSISGSQNRPSYLDQQQGSFVISAPGDYAESERYDLQEGKGVNAVSQGRLDDPHSWDPTPLEQELRLKRMGLGGSLKAKNDPSIVDWMPDHPSSLDHSFGAPPEPTKQIWDNSIHVDNTSSDTQGLLGIPFGAPKDVHIIKTGAKPVNKGSSFFGGQGSSPKNLAQAANLFDIFGNSSGRVDDLLSSFDSGVQDTFNPEFAKNIQNTNQYNSNGNKENGKSDQIQQLMQQLVDVLKGQSQQSATALKGAIESAFGG